MCQGNFAHDIQSEPKTAVGAVGVFLRGASLEWIEDLIQYCPLNGRPDVGDLEANLGSLACKHHTDRRVRYSVLDRIGHKVAEHLLEAQTIPTTPSVAGHFQFDLATWMSSTQLLQLVSEQGRQLGVCQ